MEKEPSKLWIWLDFPLPPFILLPECESHSTSNDHLINLVQHVLNQLDLVCHLSTTKYGQERFIWVVQSFGEIGQLFLEQEPCSSSLKTLTHHTGVGSVGSTKCIIDIHISKFSQRCSELCNSFLVRLDFVTISINSFTFLFNMESGISNNNSNLLVK